jgi:hypothetical protein
MFDKLKPEVFIKSFFKLQATSNYSGSPPWILSRRNPQDKPTRVSTIERIAPLKSILSAVTSISPLFPRKIAICLD